MGTWTCLSTLSFFSGFFDPGTGPQKTPIVTTAVLVLVVGLLLSDFPFPKALSFPTDRNETFTHINDNILHQVTAAGF